ncbi:MAG: hypothetical protein AAGJ87_01760 [Pseudomonadota bacterium]
MNQKTAITGIKAAAAVTIGFGALIALGASPATSGPVGYLLDVIYFPVDGAQSTASDAARLVSAVCGGVLAGWGALLWLLAGRLAPREPALAKDLILASLAIWFVVDSAASIAAGAMLNVAGNFIFAAMFGIPALQLDGARRATA